MRKWIVLVSCVCAGFLAAAQAQTQTLYKLIDKNGKVTYSESAPKPGEFDGQVIRIDINPKANTATLPQPAGRNAGQEAAEAERAATNTKIAQEKVEAAKKALAQAQENPGENEVSWIGNKGGGTRAVPTDAYRAKLDKLEADVKAAEEELRRAEGR
jgi:hypothetical protein